MPVQNIHRILADFAEIDLRTVEVGYIEPEVVYLLQNFKIKWYSKFVVFDWAEQAGLCVLDGKEDAVDACFFGFRNEIDGGLCDHPQRRF